MHLETLGDYETTSQIFAVGLSFVWTLIMLSKEPQFGVVATHSWFSLLSDLRHTFQ